MKKKEVSFCSYILPLITVIAAAFSIHWFITKWYYGIGLRNLFSFGGSISAIVCSLIGMLLIKIFSLHIEKRWLIYLISVISAAVIGFILFILTFGFPFGSLKLCIFNFAKIIILIIIEYVILNKKLEMLSEKIILILINPVIHFMITYFCISLRRFLYHWLFKTYEKLISSAPRIFNGFSSFERGDDRLADTRKKWRNNSKITRKRNQCKYS